MNSPEEIRPVAVKAARLGGAPMARRAILIALIPLAWSAGTAQAKDDPANGGPSRPKELDPVIVTARYREEVLQRMPL